MVFPLQIRCNVVYHTLKQCFPLYYVCTNICTYVCKYIKVIEWYKYHSTGLKSKLKFFFILPQTMITLLKEVTLRHAFMHMNCKWNSFSELKIIWTKSIFSWFPTDIKRHQLFNATPPKLLYIKNINIYIISHHPDIFIH